MLIYVELLLQRKLNGLLIRTGGVHRFVSVHSSRKGVLAGTFNIPLHTNSGCGKERRILIGPWGP